LFIWILLFTHNMTYPLETIVAWAKRRWFVYPWSDIYGWLANSWDYGPYGSLLRKNIADLRWKFFVQQNANIYGIDGAILMHPKVREASGHVWGFNDPLIDDKKTWERFRADKLIEDNLTIWIEKYGEDAVLANIRDGLWKDIPNLVPDSWTEQQQYDYMIKYKVKNPITKKDAERTNVRKFSLMLSTQLGVIEWDSAKVRLRPETAQAMFVDYKNVLNTMRVRLPFGLAQIGKAFRNEITPGNFLFRTREFEQMEIQMFVEADDAARQFEDFMDKSWDFWLDKLWIKKENLRNRDHADDELAHYASQARDFEYKFPRGWWELQWVHDRGTYDLTAHQEKSGKDMQYHDPISGKRFVPNVVELSMWLSRTVVTTMLDAYEEETYVDGNGKGATRVVLRFHKNIAPIKFAILPLIKKDENQIKIAKDVFDRLSQHYMCEYDEGGAIGKRYRRQDEIWTPYCITVDHQSVEDGTVTIRDRDSMEQKRVKIEEIEF